MRWKSIFYLLLVALLAPVWSVRYFLTGDGPCHLYNARVLLDLFRGGPEGDFFVEWFYLNPNLEPNWFGHAFMAAGMYLGCAPWLAEKLLQTFYLLAFGFGLRFLIRQINPNGLFISTLGLLLAWHHVFQMGFYNYSCSLAGMFWVAGFWQKYRLRLSPGRVLALALLWLALFFCHPVGLFFSFFLVGTLLAIDLSGILFGKSTSAPACISPEESSPENTWPRLRKGLFGLALAAAPVLVLLFKYLSIKDMNPAPRSQTLATLWLELRELRALQALNVSERWWAAAVSGLFLLLSLAALRDKIRRRTWTSSDLWLAALGGALLVYFFQPGGLAGAGIVPMRLQVLPFLVWLLWLGSLDFQAVVQKTVPVLAALIFAGLLCQRWPSVQKADAAVREYASAATALPECVSVLPMSFEHGGLTPAGERIATKIWLFMHAGDYLGLERTLCLLSNYEANTANFPLCWQPGRNPFAWLATATGIGWEQQPPQFDAARFERESRGARCDYVVTWCLAQSADSPEKKATQTQLETLYEPIFKSENGLAQVWRRLESD